jgi:ABC-type nickel/cobalt efflux system permease component RcnA
MRLLLLSLVTLLALAILGMPARADDAVPSNQRPAAVQAPAQSSSQGLTAGRAANPEERAAKPTYGWFSRLVFWVQEQQAVFNRRLAGNVSELSRKFSLAGAVTMILGSFLYGVFHAVGPGHGKAIISSYALANARTARRGVMLAFLASFFQALTAIVIVSLFAIVLRATRFQMEATGNTLETLRYVVITALGTVLLVTQMRRLWALEHGRPALHAGHEHDHDHGGSFHFHAHVPAPDQLEGRWSWPKAFALAFAVGLRPCLGAILVLTFALSLGIFWIGIVATFAMSLGTAITLSSLAALAVGSRGLGARIAAVAGISGDRLEAYAGVAGGLLVLCVGLLFLIASLTPHPLQ